MRRVVGRLCVVLLSLLSLTVPTALPAAASASAIEAVTCSSYNWSYYRYFNRPPVISPPITCTAAGGVAPYGYYWAYAGGDQNIQPSNQSGNTTSFRRGVGNGGYWVSSWRLYVTDAVGAIAASPVVTVEFEWETGQ